MLITQALLFMWIEGKWKECEKKGKTTEFREQKT